MYFEKIIMGKHLINLFVVVQNIFLRCSSTVIAKRVIFNDEFSPPEGLIASPEKTCRQEICLNGLWDFQGVDLLKGWKLNIGNAPELTAAKFNAWDDVKIKIPSPWNVNSYERLDGLDHYDYPVSRSILGFLTNKPANRFCQNKGEIRKGY